MSIPGITGVPAVHVPDRCRGAHRQEVDRGAVNHGTHIVDDTNGHDATVSMIDVDSGLLGNWTGVSVARSYNSCGMPMRSSYHCSRSAWCAASD